MVPHWEPRNKIVWGYYNLWRVGRNTPERIAPNLHINSAQISGWPPKCIHIGQNLWYAVKMVIRGYSTALNTYIRKEGAQNP